jgi:hypothetical protein
LSSEQAQYLTEVRTHYIAASDSIWHRLGEYIAGLPANYSENEMIDSVRKARGEAFDLSAQAAGAIRAILTPDQIAMLAPELLQLIDERSIEMRRKAERDSY